MRTMARALSILAATFLMASTAYAVPEMEVDKTVSQITANSQNATVTVRGPRASRGCVFTLILFDPTTPIGQIWYDTLLTAVSTGARVDIAYERNNDQCQVTQINLR